MDNKEMNEPIYKVECNRCHYKWYPRTNKIPNNCANPKCRSPYWNKERKYVK